MEAKLVQEPDPSPEAVLKAALKDLLPAAAPAQLQAAAELVLQPGQKLSIAEVLCNRELLFDAERSQRAVSF